MSAASDAGPSRKGSGRGHKMHRILSSSVQVWHPQAPQSITFAEMAFVEKLATCVSHQYATGVGPQALNNKAFFTLAEKVILLPSLPYSHNSLLKYLNICSIKLCICVCIYI